MTALSLRSSALVPGGRHILLVDGQCVFCSRLVSTILRRDPAGTFLFAHVQSDLGRALLLRHGRDAGDLDPIYLLANEGTERECLLLDGAVGCEVWPRLYASARVLRALPLWLLNLGYRLFARVRTPLFGRYTQCYVPTPEERARFLA
jgi:predicted DCC family thiol-disulfide oxidoreductase YuxK